MISHPMWMPGALAMDLAPLPWVGIYRKTGPGRYGPQPERNI